VADYDITVILPGRPGDVLTFSGPGRNRFFQQQVITLFKRLDGGVEMIGVRGAYQERVGKPFRI
jgi:hypothetical protein